LLIQRWRDAVLLLAALGAQLLFVLNYDAGDIHVFTIPTLLLLWGLAAAGAESIVRALERSQPVLAPVAIGLMLCFPVWQAARNFHERDLSDDTGAMRQLDALFAALPDDSFLIRENFVLDRMLMYKILGERAATGREIQAHHAIPSGVASMHASGRHVFAFSETAHWYRYEGLNVRFSPFAVQESSLFELLSSLPDGSIVALAVPGAHADAFHRAAGDALAALTTIESVAGREQSALAVVAVAGSPSAAMVAFDARSAATATTEGVRASADALAAAVTIGDRER